MHSNQVQLLDMEFVLQSSVLHTKIRNLIFDMASFFCNLFLENCFPASKKDIKNSPILLGLNLTEL